MFVLRRISYAGLKISSQKLQEKKQLAVLHSIAQMDIYPIPQQLNIAGISSQSKATQRIECLVKGVTRSYSFKPAENGPKSASPKSDGMGLGSHNWTSVCSSHQQDHGWFPDWVDQNDTSIEY